MAGKRIIKPARWPYFDYTKLPYSLAVEKSGLLFISGQTAEREDPATGQLVCRGTPDEQMLLAMEKQRLLMDAAGATPEHLVTGTHFRMANGRPAMDHGRWLKPGPPAGPSPRERFFGKHYAPGTGLFMQGNLNLQAVWCGELTLDMRPGERRYINPGFPPEPQKAIQFYEWSTNRPAALKNGVVWAAGQAPWFFDANWKVGSPPTLVEQTRFLYEKFGRILADAGATMKDVIMTRDFIVPGARPYYRATADVRHEVFGEDFPASTGVVCLALIAPDWLIEINLVAVKGGKREVVLAERARARGLTYMPGVKKGNLFFVSGTTGVDPATGKLAPGDIVAQTRQAYRNIAEVLEAGGASFDDVVKVTDYIDEAGLGDYAQAAEVRRELFGQGLPAATTAVCNRLLTPAALIEIEAIAVLD
ncbi:MAG: hypothetical protein HY683_09790 [Chloroflexi bacterium]|nr:hypothetical protein [Chloroflexota bacterium]